MQTIKAVKENYPEFKSIISAVINRIGKNSIQYVNNNGIQGGFSGFIYYNETHNFAMRHRKAIVKMLEADAEEFSQDIIGMVGNFGVFRHSKMDAEDKRDLYRYLGGAKVEQGIITNLMAWYAAETVCRWFEE